MTTNRRYRDCLHRGSAAIAVVGAMALSSCTGLGIVGDNQSPFVLTVTNIAAVPNSACTGSKGGDNGLGADVSCLGTEGATVTVSILRKNPTVASTGPLEDIFLQRYEVWFTRSDGRDVEGVDVPFRFTGALNTHLAAPSALGETTASVPVDVVRIQAKLEPPLRNMVGIFVPSTQSGTPLELSGAGIITTTAEITVHGATLSGEGLVASGRMQVTFADFKD